jgi:hypothetical protein
MRKALASRQADRAASLARPPICLGEQGLAQVTHTGTSIAFPGGVFRRLRSPVVALATLLVACGFDPAGSQSWDPPTIYREWWAATEACSGLSGDFDRIEWMVVPGESFECSSGQCVGHWDPGHTIFIAENWKEHEMVVRHEMLHDLMRRSGHPNPPFGHGCPLTWETWLTRPVMAPAPADTPTLLD